MANGVTVILVPSSSLPLLLPLPLYIARRLQVRMQLAENFLPPAPAPAPSPAQARRTPLQPATSAPPPWMWMRARRAATTACCECRRLMRTGCSAESPLHLATAMPTQPSHRWGCVGGAVLPTIVCALKGSEGCIRVCGAGRQGGGRVVPTGCSSESPLRSDTQPGHMWGRVGGAALHPLCIGVEQLERVTACTNGGDPSQPSMPLYYPENDPVSKCLCITRRTTQCLNASVLP